MMMELVLILIALGFSAFFSGSEIAFVVANRLRVEVEARRGGLVGPVVRRFVGDPGLFLTTTLVGNNVSLVVYSTAMAFYLEPPLKLFYEEALHLTAASAYPAVLATQTLFASTIVLLVGEILPKSVMREAANRAVFFLAVPLRVCYYLLLPFIKIASWSASLLIRLLKADADSFSQFMRRDFEVILEESRQSGEAFVHEDETTLVSNVLALGGMRIKESMVPRTDISAIEEGSTVDDVLARMIETGHSKLPVYRENIDHIVGVVFAYDLFGTPKSIDEVIKPVKYVPESKKSKDLLREFLATNSSIAIVIDEYGGTAGLVTREDLLEELFGDIQDEFDVEEFMLRQTSQNTFTVSGRVEIDELEQRTGLEFPEGDFETVAGYLLERLGTIPGVREEATIDGYRFVILKATPSRIDLVRIVRPVGEATAQPLDEASPPPSEHTPAQGGGGSTRPGRVPSA